MNPNNPTLSPTPSPYQPLSVKVRKYTTQDLLDQLTKYRKLVSKEFNLNSDHPETIDKFVEEK
jgi:hypothetical protein